MRVGINTLPVIRGNSGAGEVYAENLINNLAKLDRENEYFIFSHPQNKDFLNHGQDNFETIPLTGFSTKSSYRLVGEQVMIPQMAKKLGLDVLHSLSGISPILTSCGCIVSVQFLNNFYKPQLFQPFYRRFYFNSLMRLSSRKVKKVICMSEFIKKKIRTYLRIPDDKIEVIPYGVDRSVFKPLEAEEEKLEGGFRIDRPYILSVCAFSPHKNTHRLIEAYDYMRRNFKIDHQLVLVGVCADSKYHRSLEDRIEELNRENDIAFVGCLNNYRLPRLYSGASAFLFPSLCEAFGIPLIEAMACEVPIVTSNIEAMPEVIENAGVLVDPYNIEEMATKTFEVITNRDLREDLVQKGVDRVGLFSWENAARKTLSAYGDIWQTIKGRS